MPLNTVEKKQNIQKVIFTRGIPASGKTTFAKAFVEKYNDWVRVSRDDLRNMRTPYWLPRQEKLISKWELSLIISALEMGYNVVVDATNLNPTWVANIKFNIERELPDLKFIYEYKDFIDISVEECIKNDLKRPNSVGEKVIREFYNKYLNPIKPIVQNKDLNHAIIIDLDGSLATHNNRSPYDEEKCDTDIVNESLRNIILDFLNRKPSNRVLFVSGRQDKVYQKTYDWLVNKAGVTKFDLFMRKTNDRRKDDIIKHEIFETHIKDKYYIEFVADDRPRVIRMWKSLGLFVLDIGEGYEF